MISKIISQWNSRKANLEKYFKSTVQDEFCNSYKDILIKVFELVLIDKEYDLDKMTVVDNGDYQGTIIFLIPEKTYQPSESEYLITSVSYGSCSGCDTLQAIHSYNTDRKPNESEVAQYMTLALHLVQKMKSLKDLSDY